MHSFVPINLKLDEMGKLLKRQSAKAQSRKRREHE